MQEKPFVEKLATDVRRGIEGAISNPAVIRVRERKDAIVEGLSPEAAGAGVAVTIDMRSVSHSGANADIAEMRELQRTLKEAVGKPGVLQNTETAGYAGVEGTRGVDLPPKTMHYERVAGDAALPADKSTYVIPNPVNEFSAPVTTVYGPDQGTVERIIAAGLQIRQSERVGKAFMEGKSLAR